MKWIKRWLIWIVLGALFLVGVVYSLMPVAVEVEIATIERGPLQVAIKEDGIVRVRERYQVSSPVAGQLVRIELRSGDKIESGQTLLATIRPSDPSMMDSRQIAETQARAAAAQAAIERAEARRNQAKVAADLAESQFARASQLHRSKAISDEELEANEAAFRARQEELRAAAFEREIAQFEFEQAQAALGLINPSDQSSHQTFEIFAPIDGVVLRVFQESATVVTPGAPLLEVANPGDLEIVVDVLSTDAVKISPGNELRIVHWGGSENLRATVRVVEPAAFTKISALGIEEQRVNVIAEFREEHKRQFRFGDGYRVEAEIVIWERPDVILVPTAAISRSSTDWQAFVIDNGTAQRRAVKIGQRNDQFAEVIDGLRAGEMVILYPSDLIDDGVRVSAK